jgi:hypothetical protein
MKVKRCRLVNCEECSHYKQGDEDWYCSWGEQLNHDFFDFIDDEVNHEYLQNRPQCIFCQSCDYYDKEKKVCDTSVIEVEPEILKWISREEEAELPRFESHEEAKKYFKNKYPYRFHIDTSLEADGQKIYIYRLITKPEEYQKGIKEYEKHGFLTKEFMYSYQTIEIGEDGSIHILH